MNNVPILGVLATVLMPLDTFTSTSTCDCDAVSFGGTLTSFAATLHSLDFLFVADLLQGEAFLFFCFLQGTYLIFALLCLQVKYTWVVAFFCTSTLVV